MLKSVVERKKSEENYGKGKKDSKKTKRYSRRA